MNSIHEKLTATHHITFQEKFVWENWELIDCGFNMNDDTLIPVAWDDSDYLAHYPDVAQAVALKQFASGWQHYVQHGGGEGRLPGGAFATAPSVTRNCLDPWRYLEITPTHGVKPCCNIAPIAEWMPNGLSLGDLRNGEAFQLLRRQLLTGWLSNACRRCHIRPFVPLNEFQATIQGECAPAAGEAGMMAHPLRELRVEVTTKCNLRCVYCAVSQPGYSAAEMAKTTFDEIVALVSLQSRDLEIVLNGHGETTFHHDWLHLCKAIVDLGFRPSIITNLARPLNDEEASCLAGFRIVCISLDTVNADLLRNLRRRVKLSNILDNIHKIRAAAKAKRLRLPAINISCGVYNANYMHLVEFAKFCITQGICGVTFWPLVKYDDVHGVQNVYPITSLDNDKIIDAIHHLEDAIQLLHQNGIKTDAAGGFLDEWRKQVAQSRNA